MLMKKFYTMSVLCMAAFMTGCTEQVDTSARYVFEDETIRSYLEKHEQYSEYVKLLDVVPVSLQSQSTLGQLLAARGHYTCFAPTNDAIADYLQSLVEDGIIEAPSWDAFPSQEKLDSVRRVVVHSSIIDGGDFTTYNSWDFPQENNGEFPLTNLNDRKLTVRYGEDPDSIFLNFDCPMSMNNRDIPTINGIIHCIDKVIAPKDIDMSILIKRIIDEEREGFLVAAKVVAACGLLDTLSKLRDERYEYLYQTGMIPDYDATKNGWVFHGATGYQKAFAPKHRLYGFTLFAETDDFWREAIGKEPRDITPDDVQQWVADNRQFSATDKFTTEKPYTSADNLLNQWITYHILPMKIPANKLVFHVNEKGYSPQTKSLGCAVMEFYSSMGKRRLVKIFESRESNGIYINRFPNLRNGRKGDYHEASCDEDKVGCRVDNTSDNLLVNEAINGIIYGIDAPMAYTDAVRENLSRQRIRFDGMSLFPEAMTNDIRKREDLDYRYQYVHIPCNSVYQYFDNMDQNDDCHCVYLNSYGYDWCNNQADEMKAVGRYEITLKLPPVPRKGTYELRYRVLPDGNRGVVQFYFGSDKNHLQPTGIPVDLTVSGTHPSTGWEADGEDLDYNAEIDKRMRNNWKMKGEEAITNSGGSARRGGNSYILRHVLLRQTLDPDKTYYLRMKSVLESDRKEFYMDHLEWCAKEVYDNPNEPEDIW